MSQASQRVELCPVAAHADVLNPDFLSSILRSDDLSVLQIKWWQGEDAPHDNGYNFGCMKFRFQRQVSSR